MAETEQHLAYIFIKVNPNPIIKQTWAPNKDKHLSVTPREVAHDLPYNTPFTCDLCMQKIIKL